MKQKSFIKQYKITKQLHYLRLILVSILSHSNTFFIEQNLLYKLKRIMKKIMKNPRDRLFLKIHLLLYL